MLNRGGGGSGTRALFIDSGSGGYPLSEVLNERVKRGFPPKRYFFASDFLRAGVAPMRLRRSAGLSIDGLIPADNRHRNAVRSFKAAMFQRRTHLAAEPFQHPAITGCDKVAQQRAINEGGG